jgi:lipooligosaccharide transport system ATP-binding protein
MSGIFRMQYVLEVESLKKTFDGFVAVDGISFRVSHGECFGILGPNGAGKTSTIRMIYGFSPITSGNIKVFGLSISQGWRTIKSRIGVCQQDNNLDPDLTVLQNLEIFARYFDMPKDQALHRADQLLKFIALDNRKNSTVTDLSGGMMRRLVLARALINNPDLLILDEPTTGLDPQSRHQVWNKLEDLRAKGLSVLMTTHYMEEASRLCGRLVIMDRGRILVEGKPMDLIKEHVGQDVIEVAEPGDELRKYIRAESMLYDDLGHRLIIYGEEGDKLFRTISREYCKGGCLLRMATLEDVFLKLTGRELRD